MLKFLGKKGQEAAVRHQIIQSHHMSLAKIILALGGIMIILQLYLIYLISSLISQIDFVLSSSLR